jgi:solute carrier family 39 (zinc transporter), member 1/2/3
MTIFFMFFIELMAARFDVFGEQARGLEATHPSRDIMGEREKYNHANIEAQRGKHQIPLQFQSAPFSRDLITP